jgi:hypothetical protein
MFPWNIFPFNKDMKNMMGQMKPDEIDSYVNNLLEKMLPGNMKGMTNPQDLFSGMNFSGQQQPAAAPGALNSSSFETHDFVFVRIPLKNEEWIKQLKLYHTTNQLIIEHIPEFDDKHTIPLPAIVRKKGSSANFKDGTLEIKLPKNIDMQFSEIDVNEIL